MMHNAQVWPQFTINTMLPDLSGAASGVFMCAIRRWSGSLKRGMQSYCVPRRLPIQSRALKYKPTLLGYYMFIASSHVTVG